MEVLSSSLSAIVIFSDSSLCPFWISPCTNIQFCGVEEAASQQSNSAFPQEAQVTIECTIPQKFHRSIMGPKGSRIQQITRDYGVQIKFPDREENPGMSVDAWLDGSWDGQITVV